MKFTLRQTKELLTSQSGIALIGALLIKVNYHHSIDQLSMPKDRGHNLLNSDIALSMIGLLCQGKSDYDAIEPYRQDKYFPLALSIKKVPSSSRLRQRLDEVDSHWDEVATTSSMKLLREHSIQTPCYQHYIPS